MNKFTVQAIMSPPYWKADKSLRLTFHTSREMSKEELLAVLDSSGQEGWLLWAPNEISEEEIPLENAHIEGKTLSERLRGVLYALYAEMGKEGDFTTFYNHQMELIIEKIKERLP